MKNYLVSIIIPVYNTELYVEQCIKSVINQSYKNIEIIVINDGSTDSSLTICNSFRNDIRIRIFDNINQGLSKTRQFGIDVSNGDYLCTIDSDDFFEVDFITKHIRRLIITNADICLCARNDFKNHTILPVSLSKKAVDIKVTPFLINTVFYKMTDLYKLSDSWNKMYKKSFLVKSGVKFFLNNKYNGTDLLYNHQLILHCPYITIINEPLINHRFVTDSRVNKTNKPLQEGFELILENIYNEAISCENGPKFNIQLEILFLRFTIYTLGNIVHENNNKIHLQKEVNLFWSKLFVYMTNHNMNFNKIKFKVPLESRIYIYLFTRKNERLLLMYINFRKTVTFLKRNITKHLSGVQNEN